MEFLAVFLPLALLVDSAWLVLYLRDRRLVRYLRARHPAVFDAVRGRPRRWHDPPDEMWVQIRGVRRELRVVLAPLASDDPVLAEHLADVDVGERWVRRCIWMGAVVTVAFGAWIWLRFRLAAT